MPEEGVNYGATIPLSQEPPLLLGQGHPVLVYAIYIGCLIPLVTLPFTVDLSKWVETFSKIVLIGYGGTGLIFTMFTYFWNPNLLCNAANMFTYFEAKVVGRPWAWFSLEDSYAMFQGALDSVKDEVKSYTAHNFMFAISIKLRVECCFWTMGSVCAFYCLSLPLAERKVMHLFIALMGTCAMATDFNHVELFPFSFYGYNKWNNNIGRFIGYAFGFTFLFVNFMSYVVLYHLLK